MYRLDRFRALFSSLILFVFLLNSTSFAQPAYGYGDDLEALPPPSALPPPPVPGSSQVKDPIKAYRPSQDVLNQRFSSPYYVLSELVKPRKVKQVKSQKVVEKLKFKLSDGQVKREIEQTAKPRLQIEDLSKEETESLLKRLPDLPKEEKKAFRLPRNLEPEEKPEPQIIESSTPDHKNQEVATTKELKIVRKKPAGDVLPDSIIGITFSEPMIEVGSAEEANKLKIPVEIKPDTKCDAMWLGTTTLVLKPKKPLKLSTRYEVTVPKTIKSLKDTKLADNYSWTFTTPGPELLNACGPASPTRRTVVALKFNQPIETDSLLKKCDFKLDGKSIGIRLAGKKEILSAFSKFDKSIIETLNKNGKHFAVTYARAFNKDGKSLTLNLDKGIKPESGDLTSKTKADFKIDDVSELKSAYKIVKIFPEKKILETEGTGRIDIKATQATDLRSAIKYIKIKPEPKNINYYSNDYNKTISVSAKFEPERSYVLSVSSSLKSKLGTKLGEDHNLTFKTLPLNPRLNFYFTWAGELTVIPKGNDKKITFDSMNIEKVKVTTYKVSPEDWDKYRESIYNFDKLKTKLKDFEILNSFEVDTGKVRNKTITSTLDIDSLFKNSDSNVIVVFEPEYDESLKYNRSFDWEKKRLPVHIWINRTNIGVDAIGLGNKAAVYVSELATGKPIENARVNLLHKGRLIKSGTTDKDGFFRFTGDNNYNYLVPAVRVKDDVALTPRFSSSYSNPVLRWYSVTDRNLYKPGETIKVKGYVRLLSPGPENTIERADSKIGSIRYGLFAGSDPLKDGVVKLDKYGAFDFKITLPKIINRLGAGYIRLEAKSQKNERLFDVSGGSSELNFRIEEFRKPKYEFKVSSNDTAKTFIGDTVNLTAEAKYYAGPPLAEADVSWTVNTRTTEFAPPKWNEYQFNHGYEYIPANQSNYKLNNTTNKTGKCLVKLDILKSTLEKPLSVTASATMQDEDRQTWTDKKTFLIHPSNVYVGMKKNKNFYQKGDEAEVKLVAVDINGKPVDTEVDVKIIHDQYHSHYVKETSKSKTILKQKLSMANGKGKVKFNLDEAGTYKIVARAFDKNDRPNTTNISVWSTDFSSSYYNGRRQNADIKLTPEKDKYKPGETAKILVESPIAPAQGLMTLNRNGIVSTTSVKLNSHQSTINLPIEERHVPSLNLSLRVNGKNGTSAQGKTSVYVPPVNSNISIDIDSPSKELKPGEKISFNLKVKNSKSSPLAYAQIALAVVDEAILALTGYEWKDPKTVIFSGYNRSLNTESSRRYLEAQVDTLNQKKDLEAKRSTDDLAALPKPSALPPPPPGAPDGELPALPGGAGGDEYQVMKVDQPKIQMRKNLRSLVYFTPSLITDEDGTVQVSFKLPDNVTRYRIMAMAAYDKNQFGYSDASITAKLPLTIKPSAPRFANFTDKFSLPLLILNNTEEEKTVNIAARAANLKFREAQGKQVKIKANQRAQLSFPVETDMPGKSSIQFALSSGEFSDGTAVEIPVYTPVAQETVATYGMLKENKQAVLEKLAIPDMIVPESGRVAIETSSTQVPKLTDAFVYLRDYKHLCSEQLSARLLSLLTLKPYWKQLQIKQRPDSQSVVNKDFAAIVNKDLQELIARQDKEGNVGLWKLGDNKWPFVTLQTTRAFILARENDFKVPDEVFDRSIKWLKNIEKHIPENYGKESKRSLIAYSLFIRHLMKDSDPIRARRLFNEVKDQRERVSSELLARLMPVLAHSSGFEKQYKEIFDRLANRVDETASNATIEDKSYGNDCYLLFYSPRRATAVLLESLLVADPDNSLIPKLVRGLFAKAKNGKWQGTQENASALLALSRYINEYESSDADFISRIWLGNDLIIKEHMTANDNTSAKSNIPSQFIKEETGRENVTIAKTGNGELYYRIGLTYCPMRFDKRKIDRGFSISRSYEAYDKDYTDAVYKDKKGVWHFKPGSLIKVKLKFDSPAARYHVAVTDPLAAGTEGVNVNLKGSAVSKKKNNWWDWFYTWYEHENIRDDRAEVYASRINGGEYTYEYYIQATTPGEFIIPAARIEEMYAPETFGSSSIDHVVIE